MSMLGAGVGSFRPMGTPSFMVCPAAAQPKLPHTSLHTQLENLAKGNYAACMGSGTYLEAIDGSEEVDAILNQDDGVTPGEPREQRRVLKRGVITVAAVGRVPYEGADYVYEGSWQRAHGKGVKLRRIRDGASKTMMLSEVLAVDGDGRIGGVSDDIRGVWATPSMGGSTYSHKTTPNSAIKDQINGCERDAADYPAGSRLLCMEQPAIGPLAGDTFAAARSSHHGGVMAARADTSVQFYVNEVDPDVWFALGTRADTEQFRKEPETRQP